MQTFLVLLLFSVVATSFVIQPNAGARGATRTTQLLAATTEEQQQRRPISANLSATLKKPSKTLAVALDYYPSNNEATDGDLTTMSMQLRKVKASVLVTSDLTVAAAFVEEQATAQGNFPGPCPVLFMGDDIDGAIKAGVSGVIVNAAETGTVLPDDDTVDVIYKVTSPEEIFETEAAASIAYLVDANAANADEILAAIPSGSVVMASLQAMQPDNAELERGKELKALGVVTAVLLQQACVGDNEDLEYANFCVDGLTKKRSSTFNMSGLTGSTNGHFGGVATSTSTTWLRTKR
mmetsp:Transcript_18887/g.31229  ORF Transcript_18887/g.31229 Transcript_18887/m.31229 type:complete len:294 (-) Transcript_18887:158-1039(-)